MLAVQTMIERLKSRVYRLLRWSEKYTKTDMLYVGKNGFWLMSGQVISAVTALGLSILFANLLPKDVFGMYRYVLSMAGIAAAFSLTGINAAVVRAVAQGYEGVFKPAIVAQLYWSLPRVFFGLAVSAYYFYQSHTVYGLSFLAVAFLAPLASTANTYGPFLEGKQLFKQSSTYGVILNLANVTGLALVCVLFPQVILLVGTYFFVLAAVGGYLTWRTYKSFPTSERPHRKEDLEYAKKLSVMNVLSTLATQADTLLIYHLLGPVQLATYTFATLVPERIRTMFGIVATAALPKLSSKFGAADDVNIVDKVLRLAILALLITILYIIAAPFIFSLLFPEYSESIVYSQVYAFTLIAIASNIPIPALFANQRQVDLYIVSVGIPIAKIALSVAGIVLLGI